MGKYDKVTRAHLLDDGPLVITPIGVITFAALTRKYKSKKSTRKDDEGEFSLTLLVPPKHNMEILKDEVDGLMKSKFGNKVKGKNSPFADGDAAVEYLNDDDGEEVEDLAEWTRVKAKSYNRFTVRDENGEVLDDDEINKMGRNGTWARMIVKPNAYDQEQSGVNLYIDSVQLMSTKNWPKYETPGGSGGGSTDGAAFAKASDDDEDERPAKKTSLRDDDGEDERPAKKSASKRRRDDDV